MTRKPAVAGRFYKADSATLRKEVETYLSYDGEKETRTGCIVPHAGYVFSGATAGMVLSRISIPGSVIILSPNHTGMGEGFSVWSGGGWETPLGTVNIDEDLREAVLACEGAEPDEAAHSMEHSIEVVLPFLTTIREDVRIVPVTIRSADLDSLIRFGKGLTDILSRLDKPVLMVASSDMTHMEPAEQARQKDMKCIERMEQVDPEGLYRLVTGEHITMCGVFPVTSLLAACRERGVERGELVNYTNSGEVSGDLMNVVGYAGMVF